MTKTIRLLTIGGFLSFFIFGFVDNLKGAILPELLTSLSLSDTQGGTVQLGAYLGFIVACFFTGILADLAGNRLVLTIAGACLLVGLLGFSLASAFGFLILFMFVFGLGIGAIEVGGNNLIVDLHGDNRGRYLNLLAVFHGMGSLLVPLYVAGMLGLGFTWRPIVQSTLLLAILLLGFFLFVGRGSTSPVETKTENAGVDWHLLRQRGFTAQMRWFYLLIGAYVAVELGLAAWLVEYLQRERGVAEGVSQFYLSGFFVMIMIGRFLGSFVVERIGYLRSVGGALLCGTLCVFVGLLTDNGLLFLPGSGFFFSIIFPTVAAAVSELHEENAGSILGVLFTFGGLGGALGPWLVGAVSEQFGLQVGLGCTIGFALVALIALGVLARGSSSVRI